MEKNTARKFIDENKDKIIDLFMLYQWIEILYFMKLFFPKISRTDEGLKEINNKINSKTFGKIIKEYDKQYPDDNYKLKQLFKIVKDDRNSFMHIFVVMLSISKDEDVYKNGEMLLKAYSNNANLLYDKWHVLK